MRKLPPVRLLKPFTRWSYSAWSTFKCPYKFGKSYREGQRGPGSPAMDRGNAVHALSEGYLLGEIYGLPKPLKKLERQYKALLKFKKQLVVEKFWGIDNNWKTKDKDSWAVMKMDAALVTPKTVSVIDLKTGREYGSHEEQGELYATIGLARFRKIPEVDVEFWYADSGEVWGRTYTQKQYEELRKKWNERGVAMMSTTKFPAMPSDDACRFCHLRTDKGGPCDGWTTN